MAVYNIDGGIISTDIFVSVTDFGAKGDGVTSDNAAIQAALDSVKDSGGIIFFPNGTYLMTGNVLFYSNQTLWFENGATLLQGGAIDNLLMSYCGSTVTGYNGTHDCIIKGAIFDGGAYTTNNTLVGIVHAKNITFDGCTFKNAYGTWHDLEINSSYNVKVINCDFEGARKTSENGCMIQIDAINNSNTWPWPGNIGQIDSTISKYVEICGSIFHSDTLSPGIGNHSAATDDFINIHDNVFDGLTSTRGAIAFQSASNVDIHDNTFNGCTTGVGTYGSTYYIHNNRFVGVTTAASGSSSIVHNNMVNGSFVA